MRHPVTSNVIRSPEVRNAEQYIHNATTYPDPLPVRTTQGDAIKEWMCEIYTRGTPTAHVEEGIDGRHIGRGEATSPTHRCNIPVAIVKTRKRCQEYIHGKAEALFIIITSVALMVLWGVAVARVFG
jgi:hypothetical protein